MARHRWRAREKFNIEDPALIWFSSYQYLLIFCICISCTYLWYLRCWAQDKFYIEDPGLISFSQCLMFLFVIFVFLSSSIVLHIWNMCISFQYSDKYIWDIICKTFHKVWCDRKFNILDQRLWLDSILTRQEIFPELPSGAQDFISAAKVFLWETFCISLRNFFVFLFNHIFGSNRVQLVMIILSPTIVGRQQLSTGASPGTSKSFSTLVSSYQYLYNSYQYLYNSYQSVTNVFEYLNVLVTNIY